MSSRRSRLAAAGAVLSLAVVAAFGVRAWRVGTTYDDVAAYWHERAAVPGDLLYVALGDSAAQGVGADTPQEGYVGILADDLARRSGRSVRVLNLSVTGARVADVLARQLPQLAGLHPDLVTLDIGANDAGRTPVADFRRRFDAVCAQLPAGALVADVPRFGGLYALPRQGDAVTFSRVTREVLASHPALKAVAIEHATRHLGFFGYAGDTFHPSSEGYRKWAAAFQAAVATA